VEPSCGLVIGKHCNSEMCNNGRTLTVGQHTNGKATCFGYSGLTLQPVAVAAIGMLMSLMSRDVNSREISSQFMTRLSKLSMPAKYVL